MPYIPQTIQTGRTLEIKKSFARQRSDAKKLQKANLEHAVKRLVQLLNSNFTEADIYITLTYPQQEK